MRDPAWSLMMAALLVTTGPEAAPLRRRADWGFRMAARDSGAEVRGLRPGSAAARAGLRDGDRILRVNDDSLDHGRSIAAVRRRYRAGDTVRAHVARNGHTRTMAWRLAPIPEETIAGCEVRYGSVLTPQGYRVRTVLTRPAGATGRVPTIVFVPWLSCDPVEGAVPGDGWQKMLRGVAERSGWALYRVEKPGVGDSEGPDCGSNDLATDLAAFGAALDSVRTLDGVDPDRIVLFGGSIGGALAPVLAQRHPVAGLIVTGGFSHTWLEHMLDIERRRLTFEGTAPGEVHRAMRGYADFYSLYLNQELTPAEVLARRPDLTPLWYDAPDGQYGRPAPYYHQVQALNVEAAWAAVDVPVLVVDGEYDWIMGRAEAQHAVDLVNGRHPGRATLERLARTDHNLDRYPTPLDAYRDQGGQFNPDAIDRIVAWLHTRAPVGAGR